jgi:thiamine-phosphate pyrophosphorylase
MPAEDNLANIRGLYAIADTSLMSAGDLLNYSERVLAGGARVLQYRDKSSNRMLRRQQAASLAEACRRHAATFIVNDDPTLAEEVAADGVHVGRHDMALGDIRRRFPGMLIGASCYDSMALAEQALDSGADYIAFGSFFPSPTKPDAVRASLELLRAARRQLAAPIVAIGGITLDNAASLIDAGADAVAVISSVFASPDPFLASRRFSALFDIDEKL